jgi:hypothetical protein
MSKSLNLRRGGLIAAALLGLMATSAQASSTPAPERHCFFITQWQGWKSPSPDILYLKVNMHDVYRVDLSAGSSQLQWPDVHLVSIVRGGSSSVCDALDLDLSVSDNDGFREPLIAKSITKLTPEEIAAIPPKFRP